MHGWLVINEFLNNGKFSEIYQWLFAAANRQGIDLSIRTNAQLCFFASSNGFLSRELEQEHPDFVLFWDKDIPLAKTLERKGFRLFNRADAIAACDNKAETFMCLGQSGIRMPATVVAPMTYSNIGYGDMDKKLPDFFEKAENALGYPMVIKECYGSFGAQVYLAENREKAIEILKNTGNQPLIFQEYIESSRGRDVRINVVGGRPVASMLRYHETDFRANITNGGKMKNHEPDSRWIQMAVTVCRELGLDFAGVDILFGKNDEPILCEVNSNAHFKNIYDCTGINVADEIINHIRSII